MKTQIVTPRLAVLMGLLLLPPALPAQTVPPTPAGDGNGKIESETIVLSPFVVSTDQDRGYTAASAVSGSRIATSLKESSAVIGILTEEFIKDIGATTVEDAASWGTNVYFAENGPSYDPLGWLPNAFVRGLPGQAWSIARNYFISYVPVDASTIERIEMPRGPNAALYGDAPLGGLINSNSKRAKLERTFNKVGLRTDDRGSLRGTLDSNIALGRNLAIRLNAMTQRNLGWRDADVAKAHSLMLSGTWQIGPATTLRGEFLYDNRQITAPPENYLDQISRWDGITAYTAIRTSNFANSTGTTGFNNSGDYLVYESGNPGAGITNWKGLGRSTGINFGVWPDATMAAGRPGINPVVLPSREFSFTPNDSVMAEKNTRVFSAYLEHTFWNKLSVELAHSYSLPTNHRYVQNFGSGIYAVDVNKIRPDGSANPHYGEIFTDTDFHQLYQRNWVPDYRVLAAYQFKWGFMEQSIVGMAGMKRDYYNPIWSKLVHTNGSNQFTNNAVNQVHERRYLSDPNVELNLPTSGNGYEIAWRPYRILKNDVYTRYKQISMVGRYWEGKVTTTLGYRRDVVKTDRTTDLTPQAQVLVTAAPDYYWSSSDPASGYPNYAKMSSLTAGAVYFPVKWIGAFVNYSEGFQLGGVRGDLFGNPWDPPKNKGADFGLKIEFFDGQISGTVSRYQTKRVGVDNNNAPQLINQFTSIYSLLVTGYNNAGNTAAANAAQAEWDKLNPAGAFDSATTEANGWEINLTANITKNWRAIFNWALLDNSIKDAAPQGRAYYAAHTDAWHALVNDTSGNFNTTGLANQLTSIDSALLNASDGRHITGTPDYTANAYTTYRVPSGRLRGLRFGGGVRFQGPRNLGVPQVYVATSATAGGFQTPDLFADYKSPASRIASAMVGYDFKLWQQKASLQLNVDNLFDSDRLIPVSLGTYTSNAPSATNPIQGYQVVNRFAYTAPRTLSLTFNLDF